MHRNTAKHLTTLGSSGSKLLLPSRLLGWQHEVRETHFLLCWLFYLTPPRAAHLVDPTGLTSPRLKNQLASPRSESQQTLFFSKITQNPQPIVSVHDVIHIPSHISYPVFYYDICDCHILHAPAWKPVLNVCPSTCTKPNSSKPN